MARNIQVICWLILLPHVLTAKQWQVGRNYSFHTINAALLQAATGDTLLVYPGEYFEKGLVLTKKIALVGIGLPVMDGEKKFDILTIKANGVLVEGFVFRNSGVSGWNDLAAVKLYSVRNVIVRNNRLIQNFFGIYCQNAVTCIISGNHLSSNAVNEVESGNGIHCWKCDSMQILNNVVSGHRDGIYFEFVTHSQIEHNSSESNIRYGLHFMFSHFDTYTSNLFKHNGAGVSVMFSHGIRMHQNIFTESNGGAAFGILMKEISDSYVSGNRFLSNTCGIYMEGTTRVDISNNIFTSNGWAIKIQASCSATHVSHNNFFGNTFDVSTNGTLVLNTFNGNYWDKYDGYDLNRDGKGDLPYHPVSMYSMISEKNPTAMILYRSLLVGLFEKAERVLPALTPENLVDETPQMKPFKL